MYADIIMQVTVTWEKVVIQHAKIIIVLDMKANVMVLITVGITLMRTLLRQFVLSQSFIARENF